MTQSHDRRHPDDARRDKRANVDRCEKEGMIADSLEVRTALMKKVKSGECTLEEMKKELARIKRNAKKNGQITRSQAYSRG